MNLLERVPGVILLKDARARYKEEWSQIKFETEAELYVERASRSYAEDTVIFGISFDQANKDCDNLGLKWEVIHSWRFYMLLNPGRLPTLRQQELNLAALRFQNH